MTEVATAMMSIVPGNTCLQRLAAKLKTFLQRVRPCFSIANRQFTKEAIFGARHMNDNQCFQIQVTGVGSLWTDNGSLFGLFCHKHL
ncbi:hypothetical protein Bpfe_021328 [Biomphalaria pfeifferi]|uniref:Uncharacterized protein n=1 Tax=Biomphalaria pfeifferi TaxID=112525 RepID=A0AAD8F2U7_BIOPF|nr:hypothetical protein Bpfe_021328 [Biomphalaria pfeifferi]